MPNGSAARSNEFYHIPTTGQSLTVDLQRGKAYYLELMITPQHIFQKPLIELKLLTDSEGQSCLRRSHLSPDYQDFPFPDGEDPLR